MEDLRYPLGRFTPPSEYHEEARMQALRQIEETPLRLREAVDGLTEPQLDTPYREGGWTVRQVVHHVPDSHLNAYVRFKLAVTEDAPAVKVYDEAAWARLPDAARGHIDVSLALLESLHRRWVFFLRSLDADAFSRPYVHPEHGPVSLDRALALYAWHGRHHVAQITTLRDRKGW